MKLCKRILGTILLALTLLVLASGTVLAAYSYYATVQVQETGGINSYDYLPIIVDIDNDYLANNGYMSLTGLDTKVLSGSTPLKHMVADDKTLFVAPSVEADSTGNYKYTLGNSPLDSFPVIVGEDGYVTITDDDTLDGGVGGMDDFEFEQKGYVNTTSGSDKNLIYKEDAFRNYVSDANEITSGIHDEIDYLLGEDNDNTINAAVRFEAQTFTTVGAATLTKVWLKMWKNGAADPGTLTIDIQGVDGANAPDNTPISTMTYDANLLVNGSPGGWLEFDMPDVTLAAATQYAIVVKVLDYVATTVNLREDATAPTYAGGTAWWTNNSGVLWTVYAGNDLQFRAVVNLAATVTGVSSGECIVKTVADSNILTLSVTNYALAHQGNSPQTTDITGVSVPDNGNDWKLMQSNVMPYMDYYKHTVADTLIAWYQPISMIVVTNLDDRKGTDIGETGTDEEDGIITWGTNPADLDITIGSLVSSSQPLVSPTGIEEAPDIIPEGGIPATDGIVNTSKLEDNPLYPVVQIINEYTDYTDEQIWFIGATIIILIGMGLAAVKVPNHLLLAGTVGLVLSGFFMAMEIYQWWMMLIFSFVFLGSILMERKPVL